MNLKLLEDVLALLEAGSLSRAADRRNVTQPAFSRRIRALEEWVGVELIERRANRVVLHPSLAGNEAEIRAILSRLEALRQRIASRQDLSRTIVFATQHALSASVFPAVFRSFRESHPEVSWRLRTLNREECVSLFVQGEVDLLMIYEARGFPPLPFDTSIRRHVWMRDSLIPVVGGEMREQIDTGRQPLGIPPLIGYPVDSHFGRLLEQTGANQGLLARGGQVVVESAFTVGVLELVRSGAGIGWVPHGLCRNALISGDLVSLGPSLGSIPLDVTIFASASNAFAERLMGGI